MTVVSKAALGLPVVKITRLGTASKRRATSPRSTTRPSHPESSGSRTCSRASSTTATPTAPSSRTGTGDRSEVGERQGQGSEQEAGHRPRSGRGGEVPLVLRRGASQGRDGEDPPDGGAGREHPRATAPREIDGGPRGDDHQRQPAGQQRGQRRQRAGAGSGLDPIREARRRDGPERHQQPEREDERKGLRVLVVGGERFRQRDGRQPRPQDGSHHEQRPDREAHAERDHRAQGRPRAGRTALSGRRSTWPAGGGR